MTTKSDLGADKQGKFDHINRMITLLVITLSGFHCIIEEVFAYFNFVILLQRCFFLNCQNGPTNCYCFCFRSLWKFASLHSTIRRLENLPFFLQPKDQGSFPLKQI
jgi:hypothetical protein